MKTSRYEKEIIYGNKLILDGEEKDILRKCISVLKNIKKELKEAEENNREVDDVDGEARDLYQEMDDLFDDIVCYGVFEM